jgi:hypothetical protein
VQAGSAVLSRPILSRPILSRPILSRPVLTGSVLIGSALGRRLGRSGLALSERPATRLVRSELVRLGGSAASLATKARALLADLIAGLRSGLLGASVLGAGLLGARLVRDCWRVASRHPAGIAIPACAALTCAALTWSALTRSTLTLGTLTWSALARAALERAALHRASTVLSVAWVP